MTSLFAEDFRHYQILELILGKMFAVCAACNGADGISDIEGKVTRVGASECGQRASFNRRRRDRRARESDPSLAALTI